MSEEQERFETWAILELMGHRQFGGRVSEEQRFGTVMCRIDIPQPDGSFVTQYYGGGSIYAVTPTTEEIARRFASSHYRQTAYHLGLPTPSAADPEGDPLNDPYADDPDPDDEPSADDDDGGF